MKKTQVIELLHLTRRSLVPFLSIVLFVAMSVTLYAGLTWTGSALRNHVDQALDQTNACDFTVTSKLGLTDDDVNAISQLSGVSAVETGYLSYQAIRSDDGDCYCTVQSVPEQISTLDVVEGTLPDEDGEIALLSNCTQFCRYKVGDTITFEADGDDATANEGMKYLKKRTFTITALVESPDYLCTTQVSLGSNADGQQVACVFYAPKDAFASDAFQGSYPCAYVVGDGLRAANSFSDEYDAQSSELQAAIEQAGATLAAERYGSLKSNADQQISDGESQLADAKAQIDDGQQQITDGQQQIDEKKSELSDAQAQLSDAISQLSSKKEEAAAQFADAESQIAVYQAQLDQLRQQYAEGESQVTYYTNMAASLNTLSGNLMERFEQLKSELMVRQTDPDVRTWLAGRVEEINQDTADQVAAFKQDYPTRPAELDELLDGLALDATSMETSKKAAENAAGLSVAAEKIKTDAVQPGQEKLAEGKKAIDQLSSGIASAQEQLAEKRAEYDQQVSDAQQQIDSGKSQIASGKSQIADAESELADGKSQLEQSQAQYADGQAQLEDAKAKAGQLQPADWIVATRNDAYVSQVVDTTGQTLDSLRLTMASLFILVGLLVCYSVMARLVHEHLIQIGTKKALGFTLFEISKLFMGYALLTCLLGILLGVFVGAPVVQLVLMPKINMYVISDPPIFFQFTDVVGVGLSQIVLICLSAWLACRSILKRNAVELLAGERPPQAKRRFYESWPGWSRLSLLTQTMINNCFYDKRRVFGTLVGVAGCTALIVCAMTLQGGIDTTINRQQDVVERYDQVVYLADSNVSDALGSTGVTVDGVISATGCTSLKALYATQSLELPDGLKTATTLLVPQDMGALSDVMTAQVTAGDSSLGENGAYISCALAQSNHYAVGDQLSFINQDGSYTQVPIAGVFDYYGGSNMTIMSGETYASYFGQTPDYAARLVSTGYDTSAFAALVKTAEDFGSLVDSRETTRAVSDSINGLALTVVAIYIGISALVALFVLLNLNIMFVTEKRRELVVMMINGYAIEDAKRYVSSDTNIINVLGMVIGCALGSAMGVLSIRSLGNSLLVFIAQISPFAWLVGVVICALFAFVVMRIALRRVDKFKLTSMNE